VPGATHFHTAQQLPHALLHKLGLDDSLHLPSQATPQSTHVLA